jgi:hypothetical protein
MKLIKNCLKWGMKRTEERIRGDKYDKSTLYVFMEISQ